MSKGERYIGYRNVLAPEFPLKVLGLSWDNAEDVWKVKTVELDLVRLTKRAVLATIAQIFDALGFLGPVTILARLLVQLAWEARLSWDELLPEDMQMEWRDIALLLKDALTIPIPRWIGLPSLESVSIHCFTDASARCLGAVVYLVTPDCTTWYTSKSKVCPVRQAHFTIPRKELCAISLGVRLLRFVLEAVDIYFRPVSVHLWSDSQTALNWATSDTGHKEIFIRSRVDEIRKTCEKIGFLSHYIIGSSNPADLLTKRSDDPLRSSLWLEGPSILQNCEQWRPFSPSPTASDSIPIFCGTVSLKEKFAVDLPPVDNFDGLDELLKATMQSPALANTNRHVSAAETLWIRKTQYHHYSDAIAFLESLNGHPLASAQGKATMREKKISPPQICSSLHLVLDNVGLIRVKTSLARASNLSYDCRFPVLLPAADRFSSLVVRQCHIDAGHLGLNPTRARLRQKYWIPKVTCVIKRIIAQCPKCKVDRGKRYHVPSSPPLPPFRLDVHSPWAVAAVDMTGHQYVSSFHGEGVYKVYIIVFICVSTGAGHVELVPDASASSFANAFSRFTSRFGVPKLILSDHGTNFSGFQSELHKLAFDPSVEELLYSKGVEWRFSPIGAPHFNGYVERQIGILKSVIRKSVNKSLLTADQLYTVATYATCVFNQRPLCPLDADDENFVPVTPNMLVLGRDLSTVAHQVDDSILSDPDFVPGTKSLQVMAKKLKSTLSRVRKIWIQEYLHFLTLKDSNRIRMAPSTKSSILPSVGDVVLIKSGSDLRLGRIIELCPSDDAEVRSARVRTKKGDGLFPISGIRFVERGDLQNVPPPVDDRPAPAAPALVSQNRPKRQAALKARENLTKYT